MNFTAKSRYGLKIMIDLASQQEAGIVRREEIARRAGVPSDFMDQITLKLKKAGLIHSVRGRNGGYRLARASKQINVWDIFSAVEGRSLQPVACLDNLSECGAQINCSAKDAWQVIQERVSASLKDQSLESLSVSSLVQPLNSMNLDVRECPGPARG